jgi:hypothetical protein
VWGGVEGDGVLSPIEPPIELLLNGLPRPHPTRRRTNFLTWGVARRGGPVGGDGDGVELRWDGQGAHHSSLSSMCLAGLEDVLTGPTSVSP